MTENKTAYIEDDDNLMKPIVNADNNNMDCFLSTTIQSSPYTADGHLLQLNRLEKAYRIIAVALQSMRPLNTNTYAFGNYSDAFNLHEIRELVQKLSRHMNYDFPTTKGYVIAFKSSLTEETKSSIERRKNLAVIDRLSHIEANQSGGLLKYWFGVPDDIQGRNLATCWWRSKQDARKGGAGSSHRTGMARVKSWFQFWQVVEMELEISAGAKDLTLREINAH